MFLVAWEPARCTERIHTKLHCWKSTPSHFLMASTSWSISTGSSKFLMQPGQCTQRCLPSSKRPLKKHTKTAGGIFWHRLTATPHQFFLILLIYWRFYLILLKAPSILKKLPATTKAHWSLGCPQWPTAILEAFARKMNCRLKNCSTPRLLLIYPGSAPWKPRLCWRGCYSKNCKNTGFRLRMKQTNNYAMWQSWKKHTIYCEKPQSLRVMNQPTCVANQLKCWPTPSQKCVLMGKPSLLQTRLRICSTLRLLEIPTPK